ncbi:uncharacterized protein PHACADRAFT_263786 [Phanerochaete carnosa HHB-10118-sp]|uniref:Uncharacterized protein n=1 Tax=Phanerochaete carnosa (strain HHB-10118-sp) TaxID=650164 RepID=K5WJP3_PHACS|nr:uncharacterized protein PHACADRAFT_263786 [Phanerochaete carnosa HHB-10118-sp]EKM50472.1 hypothetical protein PHACADRAFT_263786 [Phanerochaete carnosa HHB-10118-sp]
MPKHLIPSTADSAESASLKHSPSKRERVRKFLHRVSSFGHRTHKHERGLSQSTAVTEAQAPGSMSSPEQHIIDLTVEPLPVKVPRRDSVSSSTGSALKHKAVSKLAAAAIDDASSFHSSAPSDSSASDSDNDKQVPESKPAKYVALFSCSHLV